MCIHHGQRSAFYSPATPCLQPQRSIEGHGMPLSAVSTTTATDAILPPTSVPVPHTTLVPLTSGFISPLISPSFHTVRMSLLQWTAQPAHQWSSLEISFCSLLNV